MPQEIVSGQLKVSKSYTKRFLERKLTKFFIVFIFQLVINENAASQNEKWRGMATISATQQNITDETYSSLAYHGISVSGSGLVQYDGGSTTHKLEIYYTEGDLSPDNSQLASTDFSYTNIDYTYLHILNGSEGGRIINKVGAAINILNHKRKYKEFINNGSTRDFSASLSAAFETSYSLNHKLKGWGIQNCISIPLISAVNQPVFGSDEFSIPTNQDSKFRSFTKNMKFLSFPSFFRIKNQCSFNKEIAVNQELCFAYIVDYFKLEHNRNVKQINHRFGISYVYKF